MSGVFGVVSRDDCAEILFYGVDYHSHLGTEYAGIAVLGEDFVRQIHNISQSQFKSKFYNDYKRIKGNKGIGVISAFDEQPIYLNSKFGPFCIVTNGFLENTKELVDDLLKNGISFSEVTKGRINTTELVAKLITQGDNLIDGIEKTFDSIEGSCSLLLLNSDGVYASRDRFCYTPLVVGRSKDAWSVTSEASAFINLDFEIMKYLEPGEIVLITENGMIEKRHGGKINQICAFLWIYTGFPASSYEGINVETVREKCGRCLARQDKDIEIDIEGVKKLSF